MSSDVKKVVWSVVLAGLTIYVLCRMANMVIYEIVPEIKLAPADALLRREQIRNDPWHSFGRIVFAFWLTSLWIWLCIFELIRVWSKSKNRNDPFGIWRVLSR